MIETSIKKTGSKPELLKPARYQIGEVVFSVNTDGSTIIRAPLSLIDQIRTSEVKVADIPTTDNSGPVTLRFFDTAQPAYLPAEVVAELKAKSDPSDPFRPVDAQVVREIVRKHRASLQR